MSDHAFRDFSVAVMRFRRAVRREIERPLLPLVSWLNGRSNRAYWTLLALVFGAVGLFLLATQ